MMTILFLMVGLIAGGMMYYFGWPWWVALLFFFIFLVKGVVADIYRFRSKRPKK